MADATYCCPSHIHCCFIQFLAGNGRISSLCRWRGNYQCAYQKLSDVNIQAATRSKLNKINHASFSALSSEHISDFSVHVSLVRKTKNKKRSVRYLKSRNPCNALVIKRLLRTSKTLTCEPNWEGQISLTPNDTMIGNQYAASEYSLGRIHLPEAWDLSTGSSGVFVGVIDTGIDYNHQDLAANIWTNSGEIASNGIDDDGNGYIDDIHGIDTINNDSNPYDDQSHGTHVAGIIGAIGNNSKGVVGINWNVTEIACKAFGSSGTGTVSAIVSCLNYLIKLKNSYGLNIVATNNSYGGFPFTNAMYNAIAASRDAGMVYVAGAGNNATNNDATPFYPASFDLANVVSVGAIDSQGVIANFSNYGATSVDISAPGVSVLNTIPGNQYAYYNGTSMATPHVTGAVALTLAYHPDYTYSQAISSILNTGTEFAALSGKSITGAILNVGEALQFDAPAETPTPTDPPEDSGPDLNNAILDITMTSSHKKSSIICDLYLPNGSENEALAGYKVSLVVKGLKKKTKSTTNANGQVDFSIKTPKAKSYAARCVSITKDPDTNKKIVIKSELSTLKTKKALKNE